MNSQTIVVPDRLAGLVYKPPLRTEHAVAVGTRSVDYVVDVSRPVLPWRWTSVLLAPLELLAVVWSIPFVILLVGSPVVLAVALVYWLVRLLLSAF